MKKLLITTFLMLSMIFFVSCGGGKDKSKEEKNDSDTTDTANDADGTTDDGTDDADSSGNEDDIEDDTDSSEETDLNCTGISVDWSSFTTYYFSGLYWAQANFGDKALDDALTLELSEVELGEYDLGKDDNANYKTCSECLMISQDYMEAENDDEIGSYTKKFFQKNGTLKIEGTDRDGNIKGTLAATLVEVTINEEDYTSTPVENGECIKIETASFDSGVCIPQCGEGWECGNDGCGGICGGGCNGQACSAEHKCVDFACDKLEVGEFDLLSYFGYYFYDAYITGQGIGDQSLPDLLEITLNTEKLTKETVTLSGDTENLGNAYLFLYEDYDEENQSVGKTYFQESGTLNFAEVEEGTMESKGNGSFRVVEIDDDFVPVAGGRCYEFEKIEWDTYVSE